MSDTDSATVRALADRHEPLTFTREELVDAVLDGIGAALDMALSVACDLQATQGDVDAAIEDAYDRGLLVTAGHLLLGSPKGGEE